jgi:leucyl-tRNA synthetase
MTEYNHKALQEKWSELWTQRDVYTVSIDKTRPKYYVLDMFPYPSGAGLHVGHPRGYVASDVFARQKRMSGYNVLHPMGYDSFGLPAEQYAIKTGNHPGQYTDELIQTFRSQLDMIGFSYDWNRQIASHQPQYYRWTQWIFLKLYNYYYDNDAGQARPIDELVGRFAQQNGNTSVNAATDYVETFTADQWNVFTSLQQQNILMQYRLAYQGYASVNWCPELGTVLANDEVITVNGKMISERGDYPVEKKSLQQWFMRITAYADRLLLGLETLDWSESIKTIQRNWIGKSLGSEISFALQSDSGQLLSVNDITVFTTRADTLFGVTYIVIAPDHRLVTELLPSITNAAEVGEYISWVANRGEDDRIADTEKTGIVLSGIMAKNPANGELLPVWIADYVLASYGTGCVMAVPAHDERDCNFAAKYTLPIKNVIQIPIDTDITQTTRYYVNDIETHNPTRSFPIVYRCVNKHTGEWYKEIIDMGRNYKTYDGQGLLENSAQFTGLDSVTARTEITTYVGGKLVTKYRMRDAVFARQRYWGEPIPLQHHSDGSITAVLQSDLPLQLPELQSYAPSGNGQSPLATSDVWVTAGYETNTMPGWAGSSWYWLRYMDPQNTDELASPESIDYWRNVDMYVGGSEHATGHLLYSRFWNKFLFDINVARDEEPFQSLRNQGMILASDGRKMSKRWGNTVTPDEMVSRFGADAFRLYECFIGPFDASQPWIVDSLVGCARFCERVWRIGQRAISATNQMDTDIAAQKILHKTIKKVTTDIIEFKFNTAVAMLMECSTALDRAESVSVDDCIRFLQILSPFAPFVTDELYSQLQKKKDNNSSDQSIHQSAWPEYNTELTIDTVSTIAVQFNGKVRGTIDSDIDMSDADLLKDLKELLVYKKWTEGKTIVKHIVIPGKIVNVITAD